MAKAEKENPKEEPKKELTATLIKEKIKERGQVLQQLQANVQRLQRELASTSDQISQTVGAIKQLQDLLPRDKKGKIAD